MNDGTTGRRGIINDVPCQEALQSAVCITCTHGYRSLAPGKRPRINGWEAVRPGTCPPPRSWGGERGQRKHTEKGAVSTGYKRIQKKKKKGVPVRRVSRQFHQ